MLASASVGVTAMGMVGCGGGYYRSPCTPGAGGLLANQSCYCPPEMGAPCYIQYDYTTDAGPDAGGSDGGSAAGSDGGADAG